MPVQVYEASHDQYVPADVHFEALPGGEAYGRFVRGFLESAPRSQSG